MIMMLIMVGWNLPVLPTCHVQAVGTGAHAVSQAQIIWKELGILPRPPRLQRQRMALLRMVLPRMVLPRLLTGLHCRGHAFISFSAECASARWQPVSESGTPPETWVTSAVTVAMWLLLLLCSHPTSFHHAGSGQDNECEIRCFVVIPPRFAMQARGRITNVSFAAL